MARTLFLVTFLAAALVVLPAGAEAASAGFCAFGNCAGVAAGVSGAIAYAGYCANVFVGCSTQTAALPAPVPPLPYTCVVQALPVGGGVVVVCAA